MCHVGVELHVEVGKKGEWHHDDSCDGPTQLLVCQRSGDTCRYIVI
jgi:hypothetical protein